MDEHIQKKTVNIVKEWLPDGRGREFLIIHLNFDITAPFTLILSTKLGVEFVQTYSRYSLGIAVGLAFDRKMIEQIITDYINEYAEL